MTGSLDDMLAATASSVTRPHDEEENTALTLTTPDGEDIDVDATALESEIAGVESVLTSPEFLSILDRAVEVGSGSEVADKDRVQGWLTQWLETIDSSLEDVKADIVRFVSLIRDELIPAIAVMRGTLNELEQAREANGYMGMGTVPPGAPGGASAAYNSLNSVTSPTGHPGAHQINGYQPGSFNANQPWNSVDTTPAQWAYDTLGTLPQKMEGLVQGNYASTPQGYTAQGSGWHPATTTTSSGGYAAVAPQPSMQQPMVAPSGGGQASGGGGYSSLSPAAQLMSRQGRGGSGGGSAKKRQSSGSSQTTRRTASGSPRGTQSGSARRSGGQSSGVTKAELQRMIAEAKRRIAAERGPQQRAASPRSLPTRRAVPSTLGGNNGSSSGAGGSKPKFVDMSTTAPAVARPDSETTSAKTPTPPSSGGGGGGGRGGMGMMPMGGMMGAMNRAGQGGPGGGPGSGGSSVEVPTDYDLSKVGKRQDAVAGGVVRPGLVTIDDIDPNEMYVSPVQRAPEAPEGEGSEGDKGQKKRGLGNIFG